jgi:hypothetical protein
MGGLVLGMNLFYIWVMKNYYTYWAKRFINDGLKSIKLIIGLGLSVAFGMQSLPIGILFFGWVLIETLLDKK